MFVQFTVESHLKRRGLSQGQLSRLSGVSLRTVNRLCRNATRSVSLDVLGAIATTLHCAPGDLIEFQAGVPRHRAGTGGRR